MTKNYDFKKVTLKTFSYEEPSILTLFSFKKEKKMLPKDNILKYNPTMTNKKLY